MDNMSLLFIAHVYTQAVFLLDRFVYAIAVTMCGMRLLTHVIYYVKLHCLYSFLYHIMSFVMFTHHYHE